MWYATGVLIIALFNRMGGISDIAMSHVNVEFDTEKQCKTYVEELMKTVPNLKSNYLNSKVNCIYIANEKESK